MAGQDRDDGIDGAGLPQVRGAVLSQLARLVEPLNRAIIGQSEVVLHDLSLLPNSVVAVAGDLTGRHPGSPATSTMLQAWYEHDLHTDLNYETSLEDGRRLRSSTLVIEDDRGPYGALCFNTDMSVWLDLHELALTVLPSGSIHSELAPHDRRLSEVSDVYEPEMFAHDLGDLASHLLRSAIEDTGVPVELMRKDHKIGVVANLRDHGFFTLRSGVEDAAKALQVTRFTIYNYLNELGGIGE